MKKKIIGICICMLLIVTALPAVGAMNIENVLERAATGSGPDLECKGGIIQNKIKPGSTVTGGFTVENIGEPGSLLDWEVTELPDFGTDWIFSPSGGEDLTPEDGTVTVVVTFIAPIVENPTYYGGVIKVCAVDNPDDYNLIAVNIGVKKNREVNKPKPENNNQGQAEINNDEWKIISIKGKCDSWSCGTILHFFSIWATPQQMSFYGVTEDTEIKINGEIYPLEENSKVKFHGFVGKSLFPLKWIIYEKQEIEPPHDITVFGVCKHIEITS